MPKKPIDMLSPEEMRNETPNTNNGNYDETRKAACNGKKFKDHCEWYDESAMIHYGLCEYDFYAPRLTLICNEAGGSGSTSTESGVL